MGDGNEAEDSVLEFVLRKSTVLSEERVSPTTWKLSPYPAHLRARVRRREVTAPGGNRMPSRWFNHRVVKKGR